MNRSIGIAVCVAVTTLLLIACPNSFHADNDSPDQGNPNVGSLTVILNNQVQGLNIIEPELEMEIATFHVLVNGAGVTQSITVEADATSATFNSLEPGEWTVTVNALNVDGVIIAGGSKSKTVTGGQNSDVTIDVQPLTGEGTLNLIVEWPDSALANPNIQVWLTPVSDNPENDDPEDISSHFVVNTDADPNSAVYSGSWSAGYYDLEITLRDGTVEVWHLVDQAVRIIEDQLSEGLFALELSELNLAGNITMNVVVDLNNPYSITLSGVEQQLGFDEQMEVSLVLQPDVAPDSIRWSVDGSRLPEEGASVSIDPVQLNLTEGAHRLNVLVRKGTMMSSRHALFNVVPIDTGDTWFFFGDSETDGRAYDEPTAVSQAVAFENIWDGSFGTPYTSVIVGQGGGITLKESYENYLATAGTDDATWINIQESGRHGQSGRGQEDPQDFGDTFEQFVRHIDANAPGAVITYETAFSFEPDEPTRNWTAFNTELRQRVALLAAEGIVVHLAEVALHIEELIAQLDRYDVIQDDDAHYTGLGNLMVALSIYRALGYNVTALDLSGIADDDVSPQHKAVAQAVAAGQ